MARPNLSYLKNFILLLIGLPAGLLTGLTSIANSIFLVPAMRYLLGLRSIRAHGTALAVTFFSALGSVLAYQQQRDIYWDLVLTFVVGQVLGVTLAARLLPSWSGPAARPFWGSLVVLCGLGMIANSQKIGPAIPLHAWVSVSSQFLLLLLLVLLTAVLVGVLSQITGLGGVFLVPAGIYLLHLAPHAAQGTAIAVLLISSLPGMILHTSRRNIDPQASFWVSLGALFGGLVGAHYAVQCLPALLILTYGIVLLAAGLLLFVRRPPAQTEPDENAA